MLSNLHIIVVYSGAHPAHQRLLADVSAENIKMLGEWPTDGQTPDTKKLRAYISTPWKLRSKQADIIVIEGITPTIIMAPLIRLFNRRPRIIALCAENPFYQAFVVGKPLLRLLMFLSFRSVSGIIASGDLVTKLAKTHLKPLPIETRYPEVSESRLNSLTELQPSLNSHKIILIGGRDERYKGVDIAVKCLELLRNTYSDAGLTVLGFPDLSEKPGLISPGFVTDISPYLSSSSVLIHPGRGEAFGIAVTEAMLAGVVPFISEWTGASSIVEKVSSELVAPLEAEKFAKRITEFWSAPAEHRKALSDKCRRVAREFSAQVADQPSLVPFIESIAQLPFPKKRQNRSGKTY